MRLDKAPRMPSAKILDWCAWMKYQVCLSQTSGAHHRHRQSNTASLNQPPAGGKGGGGGCVCASARRRTDGKKRVHRHAGLLLLCQVTIQYSPTCCRAENVRGERPPGARGGGGGGGGALPYHRTDGQGCRVWGCWTVALHPGTSRYPRHARA